MRKDRKSLFINFLFYIVLSNSSLFCTNHYPIVLVHGFIGWGPEEMGGYPYWGGNLDFQKYLESFGFEVFTVSVGPVSSNWERSVETFYQIKGGQVDYGKKHSDEWGIIQKPEGNTIVVYILIGTTITHYILSGTVWVDKLSVCLPTN